MSDDNASQGYIDYQFDLNADEHQRLWSKIRNLEQKIDDLKYDLNRAEDRISTLENQVRDYQYR